MHRAVEDATLLRPPCHVPRLSPNLRTHSDIDERQFRADGGAIKNIYQTARQADPSPHVNPLIHRGTINRTSELLKSIDTKLNEIVIITRWSLISNNLNLSRIHGTSQILAENGLRTER